MTVPMSSPNLTGVEIEAVHRTLQTPYLSLGPNLTKFEEKFAAYTGAAYAVGVSSGTAGLHLAVIAAGIGEGDLVLTTPFSFIASANCLLYERAIPIFVDIEPDTFNIDPAQVATAAADIQAGRAERWLPPAWRQAGRPARSGQLKGILPVHIFGQPVDMEPILETARQHSLAVIEDACEAVGAEYKNHKAGILGKAGVFAFYPNKQMTTGEGGMIVTDDETWYHLFRSLRNQGRDIFDSWLSHSRLGYNYRLDEMSAALGLAQLERIEELLASRERVAGWYNDRLPEIPGVQIPYLAPATSRMSWCLYVVRLAPEIDRNGVMAALEKAGVPSRAYFAPLHLQPFYQRMFGYREGDFPITEQIAQSTLALPFSGLMSESQVDFVCETLQKVISKSS